MTVSLLPCLVYLSVGIYVVFKMRGKWDGGDEAASGLVRDVVILVFAIALCYLSGGAHILCGADGSFSDVTDRIVIKLYVASSLLPCRVVKRYVFQDRSWLPFCIPAVFILLLIMFTDAMAFADIDSYNDFWFRQDIGRNGVIMSTTRTRPASFQLLEWLKKFGMIMKLKMPKVNMLRV